MNPCNHANSKSGGFTITELIVVLGIIAVLLGLLLPVVQSSRQSARDTVCKNNIRQIGIALEQLRNSKPRLPEWEYESNTAGGWSVAILPFIDPVYANNVYAGVPFDSFRGDTRHRPPIFTCPMASNEPNKWGIDRTHYTLTTRNHRRNWFIIDAPDDRLDPWLAGLEMVAPYEGVGPHRGGGFYQYWRNGQLNFIPGNGDR